MSTKELCWHLYHAGSLCQFGDIEARRVEVEAIKPEYELPTRRRLMKRVVGELPAEFVEACAQEVAAWEAWEATCEAREAAREAWEAWEAAREAAREAWEGWEAREAWEAACEAACEAREAREAAREAWEAWEATCEAREAWEAACEAREAAREAAYSKHKVEIEALHAEECPDCPWDGKTIFPR